MDKQQFTVTNVPDFLALAMKFTKQWFSDEKNWGPWFRGHADSTWELTPKLYRDKPPTRGLRAVEDELRQEFVVRAPSLSQERPQNSWEAYFLMQHSGAPTRLLDWTEAALIALYFAIRDKQNKNDAAVWVLDPWWLNKEVLHVPEVIPPGAEAGLFKVDSERYKPWLPDRYEVETELKENLPVAVYPTHFAKRISSQRSCFTIHGSDPRGFDKLPGGQSMRLAKITIPGSAIHNIEESLSIAGIDEVTVFPDLDGLGRYLASELRNEPRE
jgi:FRG domain